MLKLIFSSVLFAIISLFVFTPQIYAFTLFQDDFNNNQTGKWVVDGSSGWNIQDGKYGIKLDPGLSNTLPSDNNWNYNWTNIIYDVDLTGASGVDKNIIVKFQNKDNLIEIHGNDRGIFLDKNTSQGSWNLGFINIVLENGITYHFHTEINNEKIRVYLDNNLIFDVIEQAPLLTNWKVGLRAGTGAISPTEVWFDNVLVTSSETTTPQPTYTPVPSPTITPTPIPTIEPQTGNFELPISYIGRLNNNPNLFKTAFWDNLTATFDHAFIAGVFRPFTGITYNLTDCESGKYGITCYDSHNGTDFTSLINRNIFSVADGKIVYTSSHDSTTCTPDNGGFGCVVIIKYTGDHYGLFAHLNKIFVNQQTQVKNSTQIGIMGETGCPGCGIHLHFSVMKPTNSLKANSFNDQDWKSLLLKIQSDAGVPNKAFCQYLAPNGTGFIFIDPSGWQGTDKDPWSLPKSKGGCGVNSKYLWKYSI